VRKTLVTPFNRIKGMEPFVVGGCMDSVALNVEFIEIGFV